MKLDFQKGADSAPGNEKKLDIEDVIGKDGPWQRRVFLVAFLIAIPTATYNLSITFLAPNINHWCARPPGAEHLSVEEWRNISLVPHDQHCSRYEYLDFAGSATNSTNDTSPKQVVPCEAWDYDKSVYRSTVLSEWDLVCDREWLVSLSKSIYMVGTLFANIVFGYLADRVGRRKVIAVSGFIGISSAGICIFSTSYLMFIISRFFVSFGISGCYVTMFVLMMEVVGPEQRAMYGLTLQFGWCIGFICVPGVAYVLRDWLWIQMAFTVSSLFLLFLWWMVSESPRWLMSQGRVDEAENILFRAAEVNGISQSSIDVKVKKIMAKASEAHTCGKNTGSIFDLLRTPGLWQITLNMYFIWFVICFVYYGLTYNTNDLAGDPFVNFAASGAVEFLASFFSIIAVKQLGRRNPLAGSMIIGGLACLLMYPLPEDPWWLGVAVSMTGKLCISVSFGIVYLYTAELFPTVVRNIGVGSSSLFARFGSILAPFVRELGHATHPVVPQVVFGVLAVMSGSLVLLLPETSNCAVADTLQEAAEASKKRSKKSKI